jgi:hypothetical protein
MMTEVAFWEGRDINKQIAGMTEAVPFDGNICYESTPNGVGGHFWQIVRDAKKGESIYRLFAYPWFVNDEYQISRENWKLLPETVRPKGNKMLLDEMERALIKRWRVSYEQIMWRRYKMLSLGDMRVNEKGIRYSRMFAQEYSCSFIQSGSPVFDVTYLIPTTTYQAPVPGKRYVHGGDTSEGVEGGDYNVLYTMDMETGETVNKIRGLWKPKEFAMRVHRVAMDYGGLVGIESNNTGHAVLLKLVELWEEEEVKTGDVPYRIYSEKKSYGWNTNLLNRKTMFIDGEEALRLGNIKLAIEDDVGIDELTACQYNAKMKEEAPEGMNDDCVIALLIMWQMQKYYQFYFVEDGQEIKARSY